VRPSSPDPPGSEHVGPVFSALADSNRRFLLEALAGRDATATELAAELPVSRQAVAKHLGALSAAGLVTASRHGRETRYALTPGPLAYATSWMETIGAEWDARLTALRAHVTREGA
jgi:DNA-binding transcriptional ArsR family regulator